MKVMVMARFPILFKSPKSQFDHMPKMLHGSQAKGAKKMNSKQRPKCRFHYRMIKSFEMQA